MSKQPESLVVGKILDRLRAEAGWWAKIHGGPFQQAGIPDIIGCYEGMFVGIEVKMVGNGPSKLQYRILDLLTSSGARCGVAFNTQEATDIRDGRLNWSQQRQNWS